MYVFFVILFMIYYYLGKKTYGRTLRAAIVQTSGIPVRAGDPGPHRTRCSCSGLGSGIGGGTGGQTVNTEHTNTFRNDKCYEEKTAGGCESSRLLWPGSQEKSP